jgi:hypothetical protein
MLLSDMNEARRILPKDIRECKQMGELSMSLTELFYAQ